MKFWDLIRRAVARLRFAPRIRVKYSGRLTRLGSQYGGWVFDPEHVPRGSTILSCGLGEDASFDVEVASKHGVNVLFVDPTPRAIRHFHEILGRVGQSRTRSYSLGGRQEVASYDLRDIDSKQFALVEKALTDSSGTVRFYLPPKRDDVSHSIINFQNNYSNETPFIEVESTDFAGLIPELPPEGPSLAKFDIEGAEIAVIPQMLREGFRPHQILVEYDELSKPSARARNNFSSVHSLLKEVGYCPIYFDGRTCVTYLMETST